MVATAVVGRVPRRAPRPHDAHRDLTHSLAVFPGAEGFGTETPAGRGGRILRVTSLADDGPGTLRAAIETPGSRVIVFETSGVISLSRDLKLTEPFVTVAGQTAPAPGITLVGAGIEITTHDVLIQHLRIRPGDKKDGSKPGNRDAISIVGDDRRGREVFGVVIDHCSLSWSIDETLSALSAGVRDVTISNNLFSEALDDSIHPEGPHSKALLVGNDARRVSIIRNVFAHNEDRNPFMKGNTSTLIANTSSTTTDAGPSASTMISSSASPRSRPCSTTPLSRAPPASSIITRSWSAGMKDGTASSSTGFSPSMRQAIPARSSTWSRCVTTSLSRSLPSPSSR